MEDIIEKKEKRIKTLLINPSSRMDLPAYAFPVGLGYIASVLEENNYEVEILDIDAFRYSKEEVMEKIEKTDANFVGIGGIVTSYKYAKWVINKIKEKRPEIKVIVGGHLGNTIPHLMFKHTKADFLVLGEGEETIVELYKNIDNPENVKGIWYWKENEIIKTPIKMPSDNIDMVPAYHLFPTEKYVETMMNLEGKDVTRSINILTHRGCPYKCTFCINSKNPHKFHRIRSFESIINKIKFLKDKYGIQFVHFSADTFTWDREWTKKFCELLKNSDLNLNYSCLSRVNLVDEELLTILKDAGFIYIGYGIESASQKMLNAMNKACTVEQQKKALKLTKKLGFGTYPTFILGTPGETKETVQESVDFCKEFGLIPEFFFMTPFPLSTLYDYAIEKGLIEDEDKYVEELGECRNLTINLTDMSDEELINLKKKAERDIHKSYFIRHPIFSIGKVFKLYKNYGASFVFSLLKRRI